MVDQEIKYKILKALEVNPELSQRDLAEKLGISLGKANYCIRALIEKGLVKVQRFRNAQNKSAYFYLLTPSGIEEKARVTIRFLKAKLKEYERLREEIKQLKSEANKLV